jgi:transcriptional regulator with XRE-family HTH domain
MSVAATRIDPSEPDAKIAAITMERPAEVIERLREARGLTQAEACLRGGLARATWSRVESGSTANPHPATKIRIARALEVTPSSIWRIRPWPLHLEDIDDPRWEAATRAMARRLDRAGSLEERKRFGDRLVAVLDYADQGSTGARPDEGRWDELWQLGSSLVFDPASTPITIVEGRLVERDLDGFTPATRIRVIAAKRRRVRAQSGRLHDLVAALGEVSQRRR